MATSVLEIEELTGKRRRLLLRGASLPFRGATWGGTHLVSTQWNPGNEEATQQVLGPQELPSDWEGEWNTTRLISTPALFTNESGNANDVATAGTLHEIMESLRFDGQLLRVVWTGSINSDGTPQREKRITRIGRLTEFVGRFDTNDDLRWNATFTWISRGKRQPKTIEVRGDNLLIAARAAIVKQTELVQEIELARLRAANERKNAASTFSLGQLEAFVDGPLETLDSFARFATSVTSRLRTIGELLIKVRDTPAAIVGRLADVASNTVAVTNQFLDEASRLGPEQTSTRNKVSNMTRNAAYISRGQTSAQQVAAINADLGRRARARRSGLASGTSRSNVVEKEDLVEVHIPRQGETMMSIALKYYGDADLAAPLAKSNGLPSFTVTPPRIPIIIPTRTVLEKNLGNTV